MPKDFILYALFGGHNCLGLPPILQNDVNEL